jgi:hypothetical protein
MIHCLANQNDQSKWPLSHNRHVKIDSPKWWIFIFLWLSKWGFCTKISNQRNLFFYQCVKWALMKPLNHSSIVDRCQNKNWFQDHVAFNLSFVPFYGPTPSLVHNYIRIPSLMHLFNLFYPWNTLRCISSKNFAYVNEMMLLYETIDNKVIPPYMYVECICIY